MRSSSGLRTCVILRGVRDTIRTALMSASTFVFLASPHLSANPPQISVGGVVNAASYAPGLTPGSIATVFGSNFGSSVSAVVVMTNGLPAPVFSVSDQQINFQAPWELAGQSQASVTVSVASVSSSPVTTAILAAAPGLFALNSAAQGAVLISGTSTIAAPRGAFPDSRPANPGDVVSIYATGLGAVTTQPSTGKPVSGTSGTVALPTVTIDGIQSNVSFAGLAPGFVGLYQINVQVPQNVLNGPMIPVVLSMGGATANAVTIAVGTQPAPTYISSCSTITKSGVYMLKADISSSTSQCLLIEGDNITLDCQGHQVTISGVDGKAIIVTGVSAFGMRNCVVSANPTVNGVPQLNSSGYNLGLEISGSTLAIVAGNDIQFAEVQLSNNCWFEFNHISGYFSALWAPNIVVQGNTVDHPPAGEKGVQIFSTNGGGSSVLNNHIDGDWDHIVGDKVGSDDGILLQNESGDVVQGNIVQNVFDAGIELVETVRNDLIANNVVIYAGTAGVGAYWGTTWSGNTVRNNQVFSSSSCVYIEYIRDMTEPNGTISDFGPSSEYEFHDNTFSSNIFMDSLRRYPAVLDPSGVSNGPPV